MVAVAAWLGLTAQTVASAQLADHLGWAIVAMSRYFTVLMNCAVAVVFSCLAAGRRIGAAWLGGVSLCIALVGVVYHLLLQGFLVLPGYGVFANLMMHTVVPILVAAFWLALAPKGGLCWRDPWRWAMFVLVYFAYALARGALEGQAVYPFMDVEGLGWGRVLQTNMVIGAVLVAVAHAMVVLDGWLSRRATAASVI